MTDIKMKELCDYRYDPDTNFYTDAKPAEKDAEVAELNAEIVRLRELLKIARCPNTSCLDGSIPHQISDDEWEAEQCQFCYEKALEIDK